MFSLLLILYTSALYTVGVRFSHVAQSLLECVLVVSFFSSSSPMSAGTLGLRQSSVAMAAGRVAETPSTWDLGVSLFPPHPLSFPLLFSYLFHLSVRSAFGWLSQSITLRTRRTYIMRHICLKSKIHVRTGSVATSLCVLSTPLPRTSSVVVSSLGPLWRFKYSIAGYHGPSSLRHTSVSPLPLWNAPCCTFSSFDIKSNNFQLNSKDWCEP